MPDVSDKVTEAGVKPGFKICNNPKCEQSNPQPLASFGFMATQPDGHHKRCKRCVNAGARAYRARKKNGESKPVGNMVKLNKMLSAQGLKHCTNPRCKQINPQDINTFYLRRTGVREAWCRECHMEHWRKQYVYSPGAQEKREKTAALLKAGYKICPKCNEQLELSKFYQNRGNKDGRSVWCKMCQSLHVKNSEHAKAASRRYYQTRKGTIKARSKKYYWLNRDEIRSRAKKWRETNQQQIAAKKHMYYVSNKQAVSDRVNKWREQNPEAVKANGAKRRARERFAPGEFRPLHLKAKLELQGWLCYYCSASLEDTGFHIEHKIPLAKGGSHWPSNICLSCPTCNKQKSAMSFWDFIERMANGQFD